MASSIPKVIFPLSTLRERVAGTAPTGLNNFGQIVGSGYDNSQDAHVFLDNCGTFGTVTVLGTTGPFPGAINDQGEIVDSTQDIVSDIVQNKALLDNNEHFSDIGNPANTATFPAAINDRGQTAGHYRDTIGFEHSYVDDNGHFKTVDVPGALETFATGISNFGEIVGYFYDRGSRTKDSRISATTSRPSSTPAPRARPSRA